MDIHPNYRTPDHQVSASAGHGSSIPEVRSSVLDSVEVEDISETGLRRILGVAVGPMVEPQPGPGTSGDTVCATCSSDLAETLSDEPCDPQGLAFDTGPG